MNVSSRVVVVGEAADLLVERTTVAGIDWVSGPVAGAVLVQCSAHGQPRPARLALDGTVHWCRPERRVAPGQSVVFYDVGDSRVLGGGVAVSA